MGGEDKDVDRRGMWTDVGCGLGWGHGQTWDVDRRGMWIGMGMWTALSLRALSLFARFSLSFSKMSMAKAEGKTKGLSGSEGSDVSLLIVHNKIIFIWGCRPFTNHDQRVHKPSPISQFYEGKIVSCPYREMTVEIKLAVTIIHSPLVWNKTNMSHT